MRVLVHEWVTAGGLSNQDVPESWRVEGNAMRRAISADFHALKHVDVVMTLDERFAGETNPWETVFVEPGGELATFRSLIREVDFIVCVAPETDGILEERAALIERATARSLGSSRAAIALTSDKLRLSRHFQERGIATPPTRLFLSAEGPPGDLAFPAVVKPRDGAGCQATLLLADRSEWGPSADFPLEMLVQPLVPGIALSASFLVGRDGSARLLGVGRQLLDTRDGRICYLGGSMPEPDELAEGELCRAVEAVEGLLGFVGVDFLFDPDSGVTTVIEINPRVTTSFVGLQHRFGIGSIASAWLAAVEPMGEWVPMASSSDEPFRFYADGEIKPELR